MSASMQLDGWEYKSLSDLFYFRNGMNFTEASKGEVIKVIGVGDFKDKEAMNDFSSLSSITLSGNVSREDLLQDGDLLFVRSNGNKALIGRCVLLTGIIEPITFSGFTIRARVQSETIDRSFASKLVQSPLFKQHLHEMGGGSSISNLSQSTLADFFFYLPPLPEQRKIAEILSTWDKAIEKLEALRVAKAQMLVAQTTSILERSLRDVDQRRKASELFEPVSERGRTELPLLAVMQDKGVVRREDLERRVVMPEGGNEAYKAVRPGDFIISLRSFEGGLELAQIEGLVSPAYTVLRSNQVINDSYYSAYFKSRSFIGRVDAMVYGIRDGKQISFRDFGDMVLPNPPLDKQMRDARIFDGARAEVDLLVQQIDALKTQKRGLMQKLLSGQWRVRVTTNIEKLDTKDIGENNGQSHQF